MRILILSCNTGEGHNSVAAALAEKFVREGHFCMQVDALSLVSERVSSTVSRAHSFIYRNLPELYGRGYRREEEHALKLPEFLFTEALTGGARLVIMDAVQGCETENLAFLEEHGLAKGAKTVPALAALVQKALAGADAPLPQMPNGTQRIYDEVVSGADHPGA